MRIEYWDPDEHRCQPEICDPRTVHLHCRTDEEVVEAFLWVREAVRRSVPRDTPDSLLGPPWSVRYYCITGPGGLVRKVTP